MNHSEFLSETWFREVDAALPRHGPGDLLVVDYVTDVLSHRQHFRDEHLVKWCVRPSTSTPHEKPADITFSRSMDAEYADWFGSDSSKVEQSTRIAIPETRTWSDMLLIDPHIAKRVGPVTSPSLSISATLAIESSPFGDVVVGLNATCSGLKRSAIVDEPNVKIAAPYEVVLRWIHSPEHLLGALMLDGRLVAGSIGAISALEGVVSAPSLGTRSTRHQLSDALVRYARVRARSQVQEQVREIGGLTAPRT